MKKICLVLYVFGNTYQEYIPLYLLSLFKIYPDYGVRIYLDRKISDNIKLQLKPFEKFDVTYIEDFTDNLGMSEKAKKINQIQKCQRWLFFDSKLLEYESVYIGDVDIFFCPERTPMFEEHLRHCDTIGMPYSNIARTSKLNRKLFSKDFARNIIKFGIKESISFYFSGVKCINKLSGLHFFKTKEYFEKVKPYLQKYVDELNLLAEGKSKKYNLCSFNNETMLFDLMKDCGFGTPSFSGKSSEYNTCDDGSKIWYRPHHGLHLGTFRNSFTTNNELAVVTSDLYKSYFEYYKDFKTSPAFISLKENFSPYIIEILENMENFYK
ncbi:MAG: hypothetical protein IJC89_00025 [Clostridia bacterium]|nr:hypothetical protein [Clostridia bacterium]